MGATRLEARPIGNGREPWSRTATVRGGWYDRGMKALEWLKVLGSYVAAAIGTLAMSLLFQRQQWGAIWTFGVKGTF